MPAAESCSQNISTSSIGNCLNANLLLKPSSEDSTPTFWFVVSVGVSTGKKVVVKAKPLIKMVDQRQPIFVNICVLWSKEKEFGSQ